MPFYIYGTNYSEDIYGTQYDDFIYGYGGDDYINAGRGNDSLYGGSGNDDLIGGTGYNDYWGGSGFDWFIMSPRGSGFSDDLVHDFTFDFDKADLSAWGVSDFSQVKALLDTDSTGSATLDAYWNGYDHVLTLDGIDPRDLIASDFVYSDAGAKNQTGTGYADVMFGSRSADTLNGAGGNDKVLGGIGNDHLSGGSGDDDLMGGAGRDTLTGGSGFDAFIYAAASETPTGANRDVITDFQQGTDWIDVAQIDARADLAGNQAFSWRGAGAIAGPGQLDYSYAGGDTIISGNIGGTTAPEFQIVLDGIYVLQASDFIL